MKYLLDECLSARVGKSLREAGFDVVHAANLHLLGEVDDHVLLAKSGDILLSVVLLRRAGKTPEEQSSVLVRNLPSVEPELKDGVFATIKDDRIRVRTLPLRS